MFNTCLGLRRFPLGLPGEGRRGQLRPPSPRSSLFRSVCYGVTSTLSSPPLSRPSLSRYGWEDPHPTPSDKPPRAPLDVVAPTPEVLGVVVGQLHREVEDVYEQGDRVEGEGDVLVRLLE